MQFREHEINSQNNFIMGWYADDTSFCDELIHWHKTDPDNVNQSGSFYDGNNVIDKNIKESIDASFSVDTLEWLKFGKVLSQCSELYSKKYDYSICSGYSVKSPFGVQWYPVGGGYKSWHAERVVNDPSTIARHLVFMTYLNDVDDGGTDFFHQNITVKAEKGLTIIWPADWTFTHRSQVSHTKEKYVVTGWFELNS